MPQKQNDSSASQAKRAAPAAATGARKSTRDAAEKAPRTRTRKPKADGRQADIAGTAIESIIAADVPRSQDAGIAHSEGTAKQDLPEVALPKVKEHGKKAGRKHASKADDVLPGMVAHADDEPRKARKGKKDKVIRDSFTMPRDDYEKIAGLKKKILQMGLSAKKSEVLRAGLHALEVLSAAELKRVIEGVEKIKTGRPC